MWKQFLNISYKYHLLIALIVRIILVIYSQIHDELSEVPYTDVDYKVFTDASRHILNNNSPFDRHTYRYTPLIAFLLIPNVVLHPSFGKILFSVIDILVGILIRTIVLHNRKIYKQHLSEDEGKSCDSLKSSSVSRAVKSQNESENNSKVRNRYKSNKKSKQQRKSDKIKQQKNDKNAQADRVADYCMLFWIYNPLTVAISTRGNCDSIAAFLVLLTIYLIQCKEMSFVAGLVHGIAVHVRLYPIVYSLSYFMYLNKFGQYSINQRVTHTFVQRALMTKQLELQNKKGNVNNELVTKNAMPIAQILENKRQKKTIFKKDYLLYLVPNLKQFWLVTGCIFSLSWLTSLFYYIYGYDFLYETYLYHLVRKDTRHNFSLFFYIHYLTAGIKNIGIWQKVLSFLPQIVLLMVLSVRYGLNKFTLPFSILTQTIVTVAYNSVITSQYFIWILAVLPLTLWQFNMSKKSALILLGIWFAAQVAWLYPAYLLEFHGQNTFLFIWLQSVSFFCANMAILGRLVRCYMYKNDE